MCGQQLGEPGLLTREEGVDPLPQVRAGLVGQRPHGLVAEHRLQHLLRQHGRPAGHADLAPVRCHAVLANTAIMTIRPVPLTP